MLLDLILKPSCGGCGPTVELYGSTCKHLTHCVNCGKSMAEKHSKCYECGTPITSLIREKFKNKPWLLEDEIGQFQYHGHLEGTQTATYYLLMLQGEEFVAIPAGSCYNFNIVAQHKQLTLDEAEEKMKNRRRTADGYQRWTIKAAHNGAAAFGEIEKFDNGEGSAGGGGKGLKKTTGDEDEDEAMLHIEERKRQHEKAGWGPTRKMG